MGFLIHITFRLTITMYINWVLIQNANYVDNTKLVYANGASQNKNLQNQLCHAGNI